MAFITQTQKKEWELRPTAEIAADLARSLKVSPLLGQILVNRGIADAQAGAAFLRPKLTELLAPEQMRIQIEEFFSTVME